MNDNDDNAGAAGRRSVEASWDSAVLQLGEHLGQDKEGDVLQPSQVFRHKAFSYYPTKLNLFG